ncbi:PadR family transcriptional regulator [Amycolatopsis pigmentata]|uniref:PadR family transcriptional regulator n=1 Tax=Amycolatopsis pigmentata TaxID=450801 RepID=A0ABW5FTQ8_9PSEU
MSLRHAILSLLADRPDTGYDLAKRFDGMLSSHAWHASHSQIYPELRRMTAAGLVEVVEKGARGSRTYTITDAGRAELRDWAFNPSAAAPARNEKVLRLLALPVLDVADARRLAERVSAESDELEAQLRQSQRQVADDHDPGTRPGYAYFSAEFALRYLKLEREWARWVLENLKPGPSRRGPTAS